MKLHVSIAVEIFNSIYSAQDGRVPGPGDRDGDRCLGTQLVIALWLSINRVQAAGVIKKGGRQVKRVEKATHIEDKLVDGIQVRRHLQASTTQN